LKRAAFFTRNPAQSAASNPRRTIIGKEVAYRKSRVSRIPLPIKSPCGAADALRTLFKLRSERTTGSGCLIITAA